MLCQAVLQPGSCFIFRIYRKASCRRREQGFGARQNHICLRSLVLWHPGILRAWCIALPSSGHTDTIFMSSAVCVCQTTTKVGHVDCWLTEGRASMATWVWATLPKSCMQFFANYMRPRGGTRVYSLGRLKKLGCSSSVQHGHPCRVQTFYPPTPLPIAPHPLLSK